MFPLLIFSVVAYQDSPSLKIELPNRSHVFVERFEGVKKCAVHLVASARGVEESKATHGWRHLLEHLMAKGQRGTLDRDLESQGLFLRAHTYRDYMAISIEGPNDRIDLALDAIAEILQPVQTTPEAISQEVRLISSELAIASDHSRLSSSAWSAAYGEAGLDPQGDPETMLKATPKDILDLQNRHFAPRNVVLAACGDFDIHRIAAKAKKVVGALAERPSVPWVKRNFLPGSRAECEGAFGEMRAATAPGCLEPKTAALIAAAMAICVLNRDATMTYTLTNRNGLVSVGQTASNSGLGLAIDGLGKEDRLALFDLGRNYAEAWLRSIIEDPSSHTRLRAVLIATGSAGYPRDMLENLKRMTSAEFLEAFAQFAADRGTVVTGSLR